jgi:hypothetical protein
LAAQHHRASSRRLALIVKCAIGCVASGAIIVAGSPVVRPKATSTAVTSPTRGDARLPIELGPTTSGTTMSGVTTLSAGSFDDVGVVGVQFLVDGTSLGAEATTSPYSVVWNTTTVSNGPHVLSARARDAAGNTQTAAPITVYVQNSTAPAPGLIAAYGFNEGAGATAADSSPTANPATLRAQASWGAGRTGSALTLNGTGYADAADHPILTPGTSATFEAWVFLTGVPTEPASILSKWGRGTDDEFFLGLDAARRVCFSWRTSAAAVWGTPGYNQASGTAQVALNTWTHVAVVRTGATLSFYVNGVLDRSVAAMDANSFRNGGYSLRVGGQNRGSQKRYFPGRIDDARIYNRALTAGEIQKE